MGISHKSHGKKSDKETQSPVLKLFKDMMQKEKHDPEKTNLLKNKHERKKKYFRSKSKSDNKSVDCASSNHPTYKMNQELRNPEFEPSRTQSYPFHEGKRESWWFWGDNDAKRSNKEDTCSCVSCALKKLISSDYACIACLGILFTVSVIVAFLLVYKSIPCLNSQNGEKDSERLKRRIHSDGLSGWRWDRFGKRGKKWDDSGNSVPQSMDFTSTYQDLSGLVDSGSELSKILDGDKMSEIQSSDRLREFFKKLIKTDAQIRKLKKNNDINIDNIESVENMDDKYKTYPDRAKRSLKILNKPMKFFHFKKKHDKTVKENEKDNIVTNAKDKITKAPTLTTMKAKFKARIKRFDNTSEPKGFLIEDKKIFVQYNPKYLSKKVAKCSHVPKDSKSHEHQLKHPFYQNTQRLDELLDKFLAKNLPEIMDPFGTDIILGIEKNKCKHPKVEDILAKDAPEKNFLKDSLDLVNDKEKAVFENIKDDKEVSKSETSTFRNDIANDWEFIDRDLKREDSATNKYDVLMSISTMMYDTNLNKRTNFPSNPERAPNIRKLLQIEGYDDRSNDLKMMHADHDDVERMKKMDTSENKSKQLEMKPVSILNPNWKGPMPLYPEELNLMPKQEPIIVNKIKTPVHSKDSAPEIDEFEIDLTDTEYIEDYLHNKNDRLVEMAQAYSDYGVLNSKKEPEKKIDDNVTDKRVKLSLNGLKTGLMNGLFDRAKKDYELSEGIRIEFQPTTSSSEDIPSDILKTLRKHVKVIPSPSFKIDTFINPLQTPSMDIDFFYEIRHDDTTSMPTAKPLSKENAVIFAFGVGKRTLTSFEYDDDKIDNGEDYERDEDNPVVHIKSPFDISIFKFKRAIGNTTIGVNIIDDDATNTSTKIIKDDKMTNHSQGIELSDFFMTLSNWFAALDGVDLNLNHTSNSSIKDEKIANVTATNTYLDQKAEVKNATKELNYPIYDSDMIENIGHRSRVLLSINANLTEEAENGGSKVESKETAAETATTNITMKNISKPINKNITNNIVKRNADSNLIFWNDIYDEEYGVDLENFENSARDKHSIDKNYFIKKPNAWFQNQMRKLTDGIHRKAQSLSKKEHKIAAVDSKKEQHAKVDTKSKSNKPMYKRISRNVAEDKPKKTDFAALTAKMKAICRNTAKDIEKSRKVDVREESSEGHLASSLMQQLVRLMSDLVDFQVQQRTCRKLPPDLQQFLEWLTSSGPDTDSAKYSPEYKNEGFPEMDFSKQHDMSSDHTLDTAPSAEREDKPESRSDCLGTLQAVQELMRQFEDMNDDDKSKMAGVREYLETQISYLQKQLSSIDDFNIYNTLRYKRAAASEKNPKRIQKKRNRNLKMILNDYFKKFNKKHSFKANNQENVHNDKEKAKNNKKYMNNNGKNNAEVKNDLKVPKKEKRNLRDVYYKAIEDAKKVTTIKSHKYD